MINEKYSFRDFVGQEFTKLDAEEFNNTEIVGSNFWQDNKPFTSIFPEGMRGVTFKRCCLDNVVIPEGNIVVLDGADKCSNLQLKTQNDNEYWVVDKELKPIEPLERKQFLRLGLSLDPSSIPLTKQSDFLITKTRKEEFGVSQ